MMTFTRLPQPVIAKVHGLATAAGCQLVATCDLAVASTAATFATPGVNIGAFCSTPGVALGRAVGRKHAMEMLLTGAPISAERARASDSSIASCHPRRSTPKSARWRRSSPPSRRLPSRAASRCSTGSSSMSLGDAYDVAGHSIACDFFTEDGKEGVDAFLGKRAARWTGRT